MATVNGMILEVPFSLPYVEATSLNAYHPIDNLREIWNYALRAVFYELLFKELRTTALIFQNKLGVRTGQLVGNDYSRTHNAYPAYPTYPATILYNLCVITWKETTSVDPFQGS
jgi:hypothetical protein